MTPEETTRLLVALERIADALERPPEFVEPPCRHLEHKTVGTIGDERTICTACGEEMR